MRPFLYFVFKNSCSIVTAIGKYKFLKKLFVFARFFVILHYGLYFHDFRSVMEWELFLLFSLSPLRSTTLSYILGLTDR